MTYAEFSKEWQSDRNYIVAHTSGSTGKPKEIKLLKDDMIVSARATNRFFGLKAADTLVCPLSLDYIAAKMMAVRAFEANANLVLQTPSNNLTIDYETALLAIVPSQVDSLLQQPHLCKTIHNIIIGGAQLSDDRRAALISAGFNAYETYGMTETCSHVALKRVDENYFKAIGDVTFNVDERHCLVANVPSMSIKRVATNDVVELIDSTSFKWIGRFDNVINTGGIKVHPEQLEKTIRNVIGNDYEFYIMGAPDEKWGQIVTMVIASPDDVADEMAEKLADVLDHKIMPKKIIAVDKLERTSNGKLKRQIIG